MPRTRNIVEKNETQTQTRRRGRPSKVELAQREQAAAGRLIEVVAAAASAAAQGAVQAALSGSMGVSTVGIPQGSQSQTAGSATASKTQAPTQKTGGRPGRPPNPDSARSKARALFNELSGKMARADIINRMVEQIGIKKNVANTYFHDFDKEANGGKSTGRRGRQPTAAAA